MEILICKQGLFGGTDKLLGRLYDWLRKRNYIVDTYCSAELEIESLRNYYEVAIIPSSQIGDLYELSNCGIRINRMLIWIMGMGAFSDSYYNYPAQGFLNRTLKVLYEKEAEDTLKWLLEGNSIIFTDNVGIFNTFKRFHLECNGVYKDNIIPIAIEIPHEKMYPICGSRKGTIRIAWIGRVSADFKEIPIKHLLHDLEFWLQGRNVKIELTIVGNGDALARVKDEAEKVSYNVNFIDNIPYEKLSEYIVNNVDLLVAMGTSALDGAKVGCPTIIITPVRFTDLEKVYYRWIYDSKGYSLGEYPDIAYETEQRNCEIDEIMEEFFTYSNISNRSFEYAREFDQEKVFIDLIQRELPKIIDKEMWSHIKKFYRMKKKKVIIKKILGR